MNLFDKILDLIALPIRKLWRVAAHGTPQEQFRVIFTIAVLMVVLSLFSFNTSLMFSGYDAATYVSAAGFIARGEIDLYRTPVYPIICNICLLLGKDNGLWLIVLVQISFFVVSVILFHKACCILAPQNPLVRFIAEACYSCNIAVCLWVFNLLTESLSISCVVFLCYLLISILKGFHTLKNAVYLGFIFLFMMFLKPYFICFAPAVLIVIMMVSRKANTSTRIAFALGIMLNVGIYLAYCHQYEKKYGIFATNGVGAMNLSFQVKYWKKVKSFRSVNSNDFDWQWLEDKDCKSIKKLCEITMQDWEWIEAKSLRPVCKECKQAIIDEPGKYFHTLFGCCFASGSDIIPSHKSAKYFMTNFMICPQLPLNLWTWLLIVFIIRHLWRKRKRKVDVQVHVTFAIITVCGLFTAVAGSGFFDYGRLAMPVYPILCLMIAAPGNFREEE